MSPRAEVKEAAKQIALGETGTVPCPYCMEAWVTQGRPVHWRPARSFSITRDSTGVLYHCFRASCNNSSGFIPDVTLEHIPKKKFTPMLYGYELYPLDIDTDTPLLEKGFTCKELHDAGVKYNPIRGTYVFEIRDYQGYTVGYVDRDLTGNRKPKAITYWFNDVPKLHFARVPDTYRRTGDTIATPDPLLIVEDIPSSIKGSRYIDTVALMSSHINLEQVKHLRQLTDTVYLALDEDATDKAIKLQKRYGFYFRNFIVLPLSKDIKDMNNKELREFSERL